MKAIDNLSDAETDRAEQFLNAYNDIKRILAEQLQADTAESFLSLVSKYKHRNPWWRQYADRLRYHNDVRKLLVHDRCAPYDYPVIPSPRIVQDIAEIRDRLCSPQLVIPEFQSPVTTVDVRDTLSSVLALIHEKSYSQFPVYDHDHYEGLLTENGITRWIARYTVKQMSLIDLSEQPVSEVLSLEEQRKNCNFVSRRTTLDETVDVFATNPLLEAVLITNNGRPEESLLGIITRADILQAARD